MSIFRDSSEKIDSASVDAIADLDAVMKQIGVEYMILGATARDLVFEAGFGIPTHRLTLDVDFGIPLAAWGEYDEIVSALLASKRFTKDTKQTQRFIHGSDSLVDVIPFGAIESPAGTIMWPPNDDPSMSTIGLKEAFENSLRIRLRSEPDLVAQVCSPAGLATLKLISWNDRKDKLKGISDAQDLHFLMRHYADVEEIHPDGLASIQDVPDDELAYEQMSAWLLGRHIAAIADPNTRLRILEILGPETDETGELKLVRHMVHEQLPLDPDRPLNEALALLRSLERGITDHPTH